MPWLWRVFDRSIKKSPYIWSATQPKYKSFSMPQSCHDSDLGINFLQKFHLMKFLGMNIVPMLNPLKFSITTPLNFQNMQSVSMPVQVFWNLELIDQAEIGSQASIFCPCSPLSCVSGADLYFGGRLCFSNCQVFKNAFLRIVGISNLTVKKPTCYRTPRYVETHEWFMAATHSNQAV